MSNSPPTYTFDQKVVKQKLARLLSTKKKQFTDFGSRVNQTFEAFVFASTIKWYQDHKWKVKFVHPMVPGTTREQPKLKFSTRGKPDSYSYAVCNKSKESVHIRHQIRVCTERHRKTNKHPANICLDVAVLKPTDLSFFKTYYAVPNDRLLTFAEAKHMSAYAELIASFIGLVHELQPLRLKRIRLKGWKQGKHPAPFLYVSGTLYSTAEGLKETIVRRKYDCDIYSSVDQFTLAFK